jgi:uncharacterized damage-inducible protein DinB
MMLPELEIPYHRFVLGIRGEERTVQWILWHVHEHEIHHGGELSLALGGLGVQGVYDDM